MTNIYQPYRQEETLLSPLDHRFSVNVRLHDCEHLFVKNGFMEHIFKFYPLTMNDNSILDNAISFAVQDLKRKKPDWSRKVPEACCKGRRGLFYANQLFTPRFNKTFDRAEDANNSYATIKFHFRDLPEGQIYLQAEWVDFHELDVILDEPVYVPSGKIDYDF